ncbi:MAG: hypothetical protein VKM01_07290 [Cyanobacteriota bacterium]|nr:hypothetical protein [Cyanobacteriota bacterium]
MVHSKDNPVPDPDWLRWEVRLVHAETGLRIVHVRAHSAQGQPLGSALGEGDSAELAEARAIERLRQRLATIPPIRSVTTAAAAPEPPAASPAPSPAEAPATAAAVAAPPNDSAAAPTPEEPPADPDDWSEELAAIEAERQRIGWSRSQEGVFLQRCFGHASRNRITTYSDLLAYLAALRPLAPGADPLQAAVPLRRPELMRQCDELLAQLGWGAERGRQWLERRFGVHSRRQLADEQLLAFNIDLEGELLALDPPPAVAPGGDA